MKRGRTRAGLAKPLTGLEYSLTVIGSVPPVNHRLAERQSLHTESESVTLNLATPYGYGSCVREIVKPGAKACSGPVEIVGKGQLVVEVGFLPVSAGPQRASVQRGASRRCSIWTCS